MSALGQWLSACPDGLADIQVSHLTLSSQQVAPGDVFIALPGLATDGRRFIADALSRGAAAVVAEAEGLSDTDPRVVPISNLAAALPDLVSRFYHDPSAHMAIAAVTGTNGKTSTVDFVGQLLRILGVKAGTIGTLGARLDNAVVAAANTTPDLVSLTRQLAEWGAAGVDHVAMEASSHALDQGRVRGLNLSVGVFTNFSRDHLDYHRTEQAYADAKLGLFSDFALKRALFNADDAVASKVRGRASCPVMGISLSNREADVFVQVVSVLPLILRLHTPYGTEIVETQLAGGFNAFNLSAAIMTVVALGYSFDEVMAASRAVVSVPGRMETVDNDRGLRVVIDYAHTPEALQGALQALRPSTEGELWVVFGCGGDRDKGKRPMMAAAAAAFADQLIVTSDNPRSEDPDAIIADALAGLDGPSLKKTTTIADRRRGIEHALQQALPGDTVLIAGKGHEDYQELATGRIDFSDRVVAVQALSLGGGQ